MAEKIDPETVFVPCELGQHHSPEKFNPNCHACLVTSMIRLVDVINGDVDKKPIKPKEWF